MRKTLAILTLAGAFTSQAAAQSAPAPISTVKPAATSYVTGDTPIKDIKKPQGIAYGITVAANLNVASNKSVVGQIEGNSVLFGASALGNINYLRDRHEWLNNLSLAETWSRTPAIDTFVKSNDSLTLESLYNYFLREWTGPFLRAAAQSSILRTQRITAATETYVNNETGALSTASRFNLSDTFQPFTLNESTGWFFQPFRSEAFNAYGRIGLGGRHTFAEGARAIVDEDDERGVAYTVLKDVHQAGAELFGGLDGKAVEGRLLYNLGVSALFPFANNDDADRSIAKLTKVAVQAAAGMKVTSWLAVNYQLKVIRDVQLINAVQVQNALLLSLQYTKTSPTPDKPKSEADLAKERIAALESALQTAEQRAAAAESRLNTLPPEPAAQPEPPAVPAQGLPAPTTPAQQP
ncbi:MAG TPA: hypothetical protein VFX59_31730 [Polyangiales bacterium]|nr:hypothetical protein [Polyangiales bacterium]